MSIHGTKNRRHPIVSLKTLKVCLLTLPLVGWLAGCESDECERDTSYRSDRYEQRTYDSKEVHPRHTDTAK